MTINNIKEDNTVDRLRRFKDTHNKKINTDNDNNDKQSEKASWWINELDSLGIKKSIITKPNQIAFKTWRIFLIIKSKTLFETIRFAIVNGI
jgi:hypothetical protein